MLYNSTMLKPYDFLEGILNEIEDGLKKNVTSEILADTFSLSSTHLRRLFQFAFGQSLGSYIRSRKLSASIEDLLQTDLNVLDIALEYGLEYEQTYIRAFKREFGLTPGELRKTGQIVKIKPPLQLFDFNKMNDTVFFGPDIVVVPQFHVVGKKYELRLSDVATLPETYAYDFYNNERKKIPNALHPDVLINIATRILPPAPATGAGHCFFMPSVQVKSLDTIPDGFEHYTFPTSICARFRFIRPENSGLNMIVAQDMFKAIENFINDEQQGYFLEYMMSIDRLDTSAYNGDIKLWEWFSPVVKRHRAGSPYNACK